MAFRYSTLHILVAMAWSAVSCVESSLTSCGDLQCPMGTSCTSTGQCAKAADLAACDGQPDNVECTGSSTQVGICWAGVCQVSQCGDAIVDADEYCDDGNRTSGDGCRSDCAKVETCGDQVIDVGEDCDDGNVNVSDGCASCRLYTWQATTFVGGLQAAADSTLNEPSGVAFDKLGQIYLADSRNHRIRRINLDGSITTVAGTGTAGYSGDGGAATNAQLNLPRDVWVDGIGQIFIADTANHRIRRVTSQGRIDTVVGNGQAGREGDGGLAVAARLKLPYGVTTDGLGRIYIADRGNNKVRRVSVDGIISTIAGTGASGFQGDGGPALLAILFSPTGLWIDDSSQLYIADSENHRVRRVNSAGTIETVAGNGIGDYAGDGALARNASLQLPSRIAVGSDQQLYIADSGNHRVRRVSSNGIIDTIAGDGEPTFSGDGGSARAAGLQNPFAVAIDRTGVLYVADSLNNRIRQIANESIETISGTGSAGFSGDGAPSNSAKLGGPRAVAIDTIGQLFIADTDGNQIRKVQLDGKIVTVAGNGARGFSGDGGMALNASLNRPAGVAVDSAGIVYIADTFNHRIRRVNVDGTIDTFAGVGTSGRSGDGGPALAALMSLPTGLAMGGNGDLYFADTNNDKVRRINTDGVIEPVAGNGSGGGAIDGVLATRTRLNNPTSIVVDGAGQVYIADAQNHRIRRVKSDGIIETLVGDVRGFSPDGTFATQANVDNPVGVALDSQGRVVFSDTNNHRIRRINADGTLVTLAGSGMAGVSGEGGLAVNAGLQFPQGLVIDGTGALMVAEFESSRVRRVSPVGMVDTVAGAMFEPDRGPLATARMVGVQQLAMSANGDIYSANGTKGIIERVANGVVEQIAGRYPQDLATATLARFQNSTFGSVAGVAWDEDLGVLYATQSTGATHRVFSIQSANVNDPNSWTIKTVVNFQGSEGFADGPAASAQVRGPTGLWLDSASRILYIADTGNHAIRALDLRTQRVSTIVNKSHALGFSGDGLLAADAQLFQPRALTRCSNGDIFIADTGNQRIRRIAAATGIITTVLGFGVAAPAGQGAPAVNFPVDTPLGITCDAGNNVYTTSTTAIQMMPASDLGVVDGGGEVQTIYGAPPRNTFPSSEMACLTAIVSVDDINLQIADACSGLVVQLTRGRI
jgi:cysteine-rich repeat protein